MPNGGVGYRRLDEQLTMGAGYDTESGAFHEDELRPGRYELSFSGEQHARDRVLEIELGSEQELELGTIVLADPGYLTLELSRPERGSFETRILQAEGGTRSSRSLKGVLPPRFPLPPGEYEIELDATHYRCTPATVVIQSGKETIAPAVLTLATELTLSLLPVEGESLPDSVELQMLDAVGGERLRRTWTADEQGEFSIRLDLDPAKYRMRATAKNGREWGLSLWWSSHSGRDRFELQPRPR